MKNRNLQHSDNWATPPEYYEKLNKIYNFDFDPCPWFHDISEWDGLKVEWGERNFINPPYSRDLKTLFVTKALVEALKGKLCVLLLPVSTSTKLFKGLIEPNITEPIHFIEGRLPFIGTNTKGQKVNYHLLGTCLDMKSTIEYEGKEIPQHVKNSGMHDSMLVVFDYRLI